MYSAVWRQYGKETLRAGHELRNRSPVRGMGLLSARRVPLNVAAAFFMETLDSTIVTTSLPAIARSLETSALDLTSIVTVYLGAMAAFVPTAGWASARFGARNLFAAAIAVFTLASLVCGASPSFEVRLVARLLQGTAAAFMSPVGRLVVLRETPKEQIINAIGSSSGRG
jgi:MFS family permease